MPLHDIQLDDRRFEELVAEARRRIPVYTPEWTDHNDSDPGIALIQLFAWLEEMILWRLNKVPEKNFIKFLQLINVELNPPSPARVELTFRLASKELGGQKIDVGTRATLADAGDGPQIVFETDEDLIAVGADITALQSFDGATFKLFTETNRLKGESFFPVSETPQRDAALFVGFDRRLPDGEEIRMIIHAAATDGRSTVQGGAAARGADVAPAVVATWQYLSAAGWKPLTVKRDDTRNLTRTGNILFIAPNDPVAAQIGLLRRPNDPPLWWIRYHIDDVLGAGYETTPRIEDVVINTIGATSAITQTGEVLGASNGRPNQAFTIANTPILPESPKPKGIVEVLENFDQQWETWTEVSDFAASKREDKHYTLNRTTGVVTFGDGVHGKIPRWLPSDPLNPQADTANIRVTRYRWGGGSRANAGAGKITSLQSPVPYVASVTNLREAIGGEDEETVQQARLRAPMAIRTASRAVTVEDFAFLAQQTPGAHIRRAQAFPLHNPKFGLRRAGATGVMTEVPMPGVVTVVVVPESTNPAPQPSEDTLRAVAAWLDEHRLVTSELNVMGPRYREVSVRAKVIARSDASKGEVERVLQEKLLGYFHPLRGGPSGEGWEFGGTIFFSDVYRQILSTDGVLRLPADQVQIFVNGQMTVCNDIELEPDELVFSVNHDIRVSYE